MKILGTILVVGGLIGLILTGVNYINDTESFSLFGLDIAVSKGNIMPVIISAIIFIAGLLVVKSSNRK